MHKKKKEITKRTLRPQSPKLEALSLNRANLPDEKLRVQSVDCSAIDEIDIRTKAMEFTTDGVFLIDATNPDLQIIYANSSFARITGFSHQETIGKGYFLLKGLFFDPRMVEEIKATLNEGKPFHGEMLNFKKNGEKYWNLLRITPMRDATGTITHYIGIKTDVTMMRQKNAEIEEQREELLHVTRVGKLAEFVSSLAHEISQPLTAVLSYAEAAKRMLKSREPQVAEILQFIIEDNQRAAEVIRRLRTLLKKGKSTFHSIDMNILIRDTVLLIQTDVTVRNKIIRTDLAQGLSLIQGDRIQLQQVLLNLISNSLEAMEGIEDAREMVIKTTQKDTNTVLVEVKDSGGGILEKNLSKVFTHFFTTKPDGLGMGLSISRSIVESHGGRMDVANNPDRGANFYFTLPAVPLKEEEGKGIV